VISPKELPDCWIACVPVPLNVIVSDPCLYSAFAVSMMRSPFTEMSAFPSFRTLAVLFVEPVIDRFFVTVIALPPAIVNFAVAPPASSLKKRFPPYVRSATVLSPSRYRASMSRRPPVAILPSLSPLKSISPVPVPRTREVLPGRSSVPALAIVSVLMNAGSVNMGAIVARQQEPLLGWLPDWNLFTQPIAALIFLGGCATALKRESRCLASLTPEIVQAKEEMANLEASWHDSLGRRDAVFGQTAAPFGSLAGSMAAPWLVWRFGAAWTALLRISGVVLAATIGGSALLCLFETWLARPLRRWRGEAEPKAPDPLFPERRGEA